MTERVAEEIRSQMGRRRLSGADLAKALGVSPMWVSYRLRGMQEIGVNDLERIAQVLGVDLLELLPREVRSSPSGRLARAGVITGRKPGVSRPKRQVPPARPGRTSRIRQTT